MSEVYSEFKEVSGPDTKYNVWASVTEFQQQKRWATISRYAIRIHWSDDIDFDTFISYHDELTPDTYAMSDAIRKCINLVDVIVDRLQWRKSELTNPKAKANEPIPF